MIIIDQAEITDRLRDKGWRLDNVRVYVNLFKIDQPEDPRTVAVVYRTDVAEMDRSHPERGFCRHCGAWIKRMSVEESNAYNAKLAANDPNDTKLDEISDPGHWLPVTDGATILCPKHDDGRNVHRLDDPLSVRMWREGEWTFGGVEVQVASVDGAELGIAETENIPYGRYPSTIDPATGEVECRALNPLDFDGEIVQAILPLALQDAVKNLNLINRVAITQPPGWPAGAFDSEGQTARD